MFDTSFYCFAGPWTGNFYYRSEIALKYGDFKPALRHPKGCFPNNGILPEYTLNKDEPDHGDPVHFDFLISRQREADC